MEERDQNPKTAGSGGYRPAGRKGELSEPKSNARVKGGRRKIPMPTLETGESQDRFAEIGEGFAGNGRKGGNPMSKHIFSRGAVLP